MAKTATLARGPSAAPANNPPQFQAPHGRAVAVGRDGRPIYRNTGAENDPYAIDPHIIPEGWVYEWKRYSIYNQVDNPYQAKLARVGGWTPVPAERHDGMFLPPGAKGSIIHDGLILMERPLVLHREALGEDKKNADAAMRKAKTERGLAPASAGISTNTAEARAATFVRQAPLTADDMQAMAEVPHGNYNYDRQTID